MKPTPEENYLLEAIFAARQVQDFLWGKHNKAWTLEEWKRMFRKRWVKIDDIDESNPHCLIELKKRVLQNAALSIALLSAIENGLPQDCDVPTNLAEYSERTDE
jgi:hypothetical protein